MSRVHVTTWTLVLAGLDQQVQRKALPGCPQAEHSLHHPAPRSMWLARPTVQREVGWLSSLRDVRLYYSYWREVLPVNRIEEEVSLRLSRAGRGSSGVDNPHYLSVVFTMQYVPSYLVRPTLGTQPAVCTWYLPCSTYLLIWWDQHWVHNQLSARSIYHTVRLHNQLSVVVFTMQYVPLYLVRPTLGTQPAVWPWCLPCSTYLLIWWDQRWVHNQLSGRGVYHAVRTFLSGETNTGYTTSCLSVVFIMQYLSSTHSTWMPRRYDEHITSWRAHASPFSLTNATVTESPLSSVDWRSCW